jgi:hypothetical protein
MNGYLNNLAQRSMDLGNRVEPRLPSMFEAAAVNVGPAPKVDGRVEPYEEDATAASAAAADHVKPERTNDRVSADPMEKTTSRVEDSTPTPVSSQPDHSEAASVESLTLSVPEKTREVIAESQAEAHVTKRPPEVENPLPEMHEERVVETHVPVEHAGLAPFSPQSQIETTTRVELDQPAEVTDVAPPAQRSDRQTAPLAPRKTAPFESRPNDETAQSDGPIELEAFVDDPVNTSGLPVDARVFQSLDPSVSIPRQVTPTPWRDVRSQPGRWARRRLAGPTEPEPSINVTIGRIEIRAVPADNRKTTSTRRSESPVMPLDEYLKKQRRGAER